MPTTSMPNTSATMPTPRRNALTSEHPEAHAKHTEKVSHEAAPAEVKGEDSDEKTSCSAGPHPKQPRPIKPIAPPRPERPYPWVG